MLPTLTPQQVDKTLEIAAAREANEHARLDATLKQDGEEKTGRRRMAQGALVVLGVFVLLVSYRHEYEWAEKILLPVATGFVGYLAGKNQPSKKDSD